MCDFVCAAVEELPVEGVKEGSKEGGRSVRSCACDRVCSAVMKISVAAVVVQALSFLVSTGEY